MIEIKGLSYEKNLKYQAAIRAGYFDGYEDAPQFFWHTFVGKFIHDWPGRTKTLDRLKEIVGHVPVWEDLTDDTLDDFVFSMQDSNMKSSSVKTICAELKAVINDNRRKVPSEEYMRKLTIKGSVSQHVYLTREEIQRIMNYTVVGEIERFVRRNFVVMCLTGARYCDAIRFTIDNCNIDTQMISYIPKKTPKIVVNVPVDEGMSLRNFLADRYRRECCPDVFNDYVRRICKACRINRNVTINREDEEVTGPKWQFVSAHTGRRSFATNLYLAYVPIEDIALMMGHGKNIETTKRYICAERQVSPAAFSYFQPKTEENQ